jgi:cobalamin biosynthesis protein CbiD
METLIACALDAGAPLTLLHQIRDCVSCDAALECLRGEGFIEPTMSLLRGRIKDTLGRHIAENLDMKLICFCGMGEKMEELFSI